MSPEAPSERTLTFEPGGKLAALFGDRTGLLIFLCTIILYVLTLRSGVFINDSYTILNSLVAVAEGHLQVDPSIYGWGPGLHTVKGLHYGRNYGHVFLSVPLLWGMRLLGNVADVRIVVFGMWSLSLLVFADQLGVVLKRRERLRLGGSIVALVFFAGNLIVAYPLSQKTQVILALQWTTVFSAAGTAVVIYRLLNEMYDRKQGFVAGAFVGLASPVGFWAVLLKRHAVTAFLCVLVVYWFYRSRSGSEASERLRFRVLAYACVGLTAWFHAPEAFILLVALGLVDLSTARANGVRRIAPIAIGFLIALFPFLITNAVISGDPLKPPRLLPNYQGEGGSQTGQSSWAKGGGGGGFLGGLLPGQLAFITSVLIRFTTRLGTSAVALVDPERLIVVFVRSGYIADVARWESNLPIRLSFLESMPLSGGLVAVPIVAYHRLRHSNRGFKRVANPRVATDALVVLISLLFVLVYWPRLPIHASVTVRYLHPLYPLAGYMLFRLPAIRRVVAEQWQMLAWSYGSFLLIGGQLFLVLLATVPDTFAEAYQLHALVAVGAGTALACWAVYATVRDPPVKVGAVLMSFAASVSTTFLLLAAFLYFDYSRDYALPLSRSIARALNFL